MNTTKDNPPTDKAVKGASRLVDTLTRIESRLGTGPSPDDLFSDGARDEQVTVGKRTYSATKQVAQHTKFRTEVRDEYGRPAMTRSELDNAKAGAYLKRIAQRAGIDVAWREEDDALLDECYKAPWIGLSGGEWHDQAAPISGQRAKALLDDAPSGGV
ncbi:MAG: hypothetical protein IIA67_08790 [Planctomycetes bacterium]|nr:hypothetical protein [Planctomycetota bacterium]